MTIYAAIAASIAPVLPQFTIAGPSFIVQRATGGTPTADPTITEYPARTMYVIPSALSQFARTFPEVEVWKCSYLLFDFAINDERAKDVISDGTQAFLITGQPTLDYGFLLAPAERCAVPAGATPPTGGRRGRWIGIRAIPTYAT